MRLLDRYETLLVECIENLKNSLEYELKENNEKFFNEGFIQFKLSKYLKQNGINEELIRIGHQLKLPGRKYPLKIDISLADLIFLEIKFLRLGDQEKNPAKPKKFGELWKDLAKLSYKKENSGSYVLLLYDKMFYNYLKRHFQNMCNNKNYILKNSALLDIKDRIMLTPTMKKELKGLSLENIEQIKILKNLRLSKDFNLSIYKLL